MLISLAFVLSIAILINTSNAAIEGPVYPAPGGNNFSANGAAVNMGKAGGITFAYSNFDLSGLSSLFWGPWDQNSIGIALDSGGYTGSEILSFNSISGNQAIWTGSAFTQYLVGSTMTNQTLQTRLTITVTDTTNSPVNFINSSTIGLTNGAVAPITGDFQANLLMEAFYYTDYLGHATGWYPVVDGFNTFHTNPAFKTSMNFSGGMFYEAVPLPGAVWLLGTGIVGLAALRRKVQK